jgi:hypothetical protein
MPLAQHGDQGQVDGFVFSNDDFLNIFTQFTGYVCNHERLLGGEDFV